MGLAYVGLDGLAAMHGGEQPMLDALCAAVPEDFQAQVGLGPNKFTAFVAARSSRSAGLSRTQGDPAAFLAPHPLSLLPARARSAGRPAPARLADPGRYGGSGAGRAARPLRHGRPARVGAGLGDRPAPPAAAHRGRVCRGDALAAYRVELAGVAARGGRHAAHPRLRPTRDAGPLCGHGDADLRPGGRSGLAEGVSFQATLSATGGGRPRSSRPGWRASIPGPRSRR